MIMSLVQLTGKQVHAPLEHCHLKIIDSASIIFINILISSYQRIIQIDFIRERIETSLHLLHICSDWKRQGMHPSREDWKLRIWMLLDQKLPTEYYLGHLQRPLVQLLFERWRYTYWKECPSWQSHQRNHKMRKHKCPKTLMNLCWCWGT